MKTLIAFLCLLPTLALANPAPALLPCDTKDNLLTTIAKYQEQPLAQGKVILNHPQGRSYEFPMLLFVNMEEKTYTLIALTAEDYGCIVAIGSEFTPVLSGDPI